MHHPFACAVLNGSQLLRCTLPDESPTIVGPCELLQDDVVVQHEDGGYSMSVTFYSPNAIPKENTRWNGFLQCTGFEPEEKMHEIYLGEIVTRRQCQSQVHQLPFAPQHVSFVVENHLINKHKKPFDPSEVNFVEHVRDILEDPVVNPRHGSLQLSIVQTIAENHPNYRDVIEKRYGGDWCLFVLHHPDFFTVFNYSSEEIVGRGMTNYVNPAELRIVHKKGKRVQFYSDSEESEMVDFLKKVLMDCDLTAENVLCKIHEAGLGYSIAPAFSQLMRFLGRNKQLFYWSTNPSQVTMVGLSPDFDLSTYCDEYAPAA
ncbi:hypothetical protein DIPPA_12400 [Diplonema papillatum]|nr:hypothetical protein DIPPA_12400 [Diplonema papillatum]|eukprot:gene4688-7195_t